MVRLDGHVALLNKCNDRLEQQFGDLQATITTLRMNFKHTNRTTLQSVFTSGRTRSDMLCDVGDIQCVLKDEGAESALRPCFTQVYSRMFHLATKSTTETTLKALLCQMVNYTK